MGPLLNDEQRAWQKQARQFAEEEIRPVSLERDRSNKRTKIRIDLTGYWSDRRSRAV